MKKVVLIIDEPNECWECPCCYDFMRCQAEEDAKVYGEKPPYNCPLKPMPQKLPIESGSIMNTFRDSTKYKHIGYNKCIDEILGEL